MSEFTLIQNHFARKSKRNDVLLGVGDDAAVLSLPADRRLVVAVDTIVEGVHFPLGTPPSAVGHRALAVNLSDIAAMGAEPTWATMSLSVAENNAAWLEAFSTGFFALADRYSVSLVGGDTVRRNLSITVSVMGVVELDGWIRRDGARPGDTIFVSGIPGEAAAGLSFLQRGNPSVAEAQLIDRFLWPEPRVQLGRTVRTLASSAIDISDGLLADLEHICESSGCGARVDVESLPQSAAMRSVCGESEREAFALTGGDDYELLFTVPPEKMLDVEAAIASGVRCTPIGRMTEDRALLCCRGGEPMNLPRRGYDHFA